MLTPATEKQLRLSEPCVLKDAVQYLSMLQQQAEKTDSMGLNAIASPADFVRALEECSKEPYSLIVGRNVTFQRYGEGIDRPEGKNVPINIALLARRFDIDKHLRERLLDSAVAALSNCLLGDYVSNPVAGCDHPVFNDFITPREQLVLELGALIHAVKRGEKVAGVQPPFDEQSLRSL